jgi:hypothetical protein
MTAHVCHLVLLSTGLILAVAACRRQSPEDRAAGMPAGSAVVAARSSGMRIVQVLVPDSAGLRHFLETVDTVRGATVDVHWSSNTVRLDRVETLRSLRRVSRDGVTFTFDPAEPKIRGLHPGQVLLVWGVALRKVTGVEARSSAIIVRTDPVSLPEAIQNGSLAWKTQTSFAQGLITPAAPETDSGTRRVGLGGEPRLYHLAAYPLRPSGWGPAGQGENAGWNQTHEAGGEAPEAELPHHAEGEVGGYEFEIGYGWDGARLQFALEARKGDSPAFDKPEEAQGERTRAHGTRAMGGGGQEKPEVKPLTEEEKRQAKEREEEEANTKPGVGEIEHPGSALTPKGLFGLASEVFDLRIRVRGHLDDFATEGRLVIANASLGNFRVAISDIHGEADLDWIARLGASGTFSENVKVEVPWNFDVPLIIAGIPFVVEIGVNFLAAPALTSRYASAAGSYHIALQGGVTIEATPSAMNTEGGLTGTPETTHRQVTSLGVSGILVAAQMPRIGFGLGLFNTSAVAYVDHVLATSIVSAGGTSLVPCRRFQMNSAVGAGLGVQLLGIPIPGLGKKRILAQHDWVTTEPEGANCKV